jgi:hypothetical protein
MAQLQEGKKAKWIALCSGASGACCHTSDSHASAHSMSWNVIATSDACLLPSVVNLQAAAEASQQQLRDDWNKQRRALQGIVHG